MTRRRTGQSLVEALVFLCLLIPLSGLFVDLTMFLSAVQLDAVASREASYAASKGPPNAVIKGEPKRNATDALKSLRIGNGLIRIDPDCLVEEKIFSLPSQPFGGPVEGRVSVKTRCTVKMPFSDCLLRREATTVTATQTYAYSWVMPPNTAIQSSPHDSSAFNAY